jgi:hypothetical protein
MLIPWIGAFAAQTSREPIIRWFASMRRNSEPDDAPAWRRDPFLHPQIRSMTREQQADLPIDPRTIRTD